MNQKQWEVEIVVNAPLKSVWELAEDITLIPRYHPEVDKVDLIAGQAKRSVGVKYQCNILHGRRAGSCVEEVIACDPERMLATRMVSDTWGIDGMLANFRVETDRFTSHRNVDHPAVPGVLRPRRLQEPDVERYVPSASNSQEITRRNERHQGHRGGEVRRVT